MKLKRGTLKIRDSARACLNIETRYQSLTLFLGPMIFIWQLKMMLKVIKVLHFLN